MKTTLDRTKFQFHRFSGNGFVVVSDVPNRPEYCYVGEVFTGPTGAWLLGGRFLVAHKTMLTPEMRFIDPHKCELGKKEAEIPPDALVAMDRVRNQIESGTHKIVNTRLVRS